MFFIYLSSSCFTSSLLSLTFLHLSSFHSNRFGFHFLFFTLCPSYCCCAIMTTGKEIGKELKTAYVKDDDDSGTHYFTSLIINITYTLNNVSVFYTYFSFLHCNVIFILLVIITSIIFSYNFQ